MDGKVFAVVALDELHIDESYQRSLQNHVKVIARDWNPTKCDPLKINFREDGFFYVWDGQHRLEAARLRGIKYLLCLNQIKNMDVHMDILIMRMVIRAMEVYHVQVHMHGE